MTKVWFITGTSKGFGREWAEAALERGDQVAATARDPATLDDLATHFGDSVLPLPLDVTDRAAGFAAVQAASRHFGRLDIVVNNAGYGHFGMIEELTEAEIRAQMETNFFGALWVTQAALPVMREQGSGHVIQISSIGGITAFPGIGAYHASRVGARGLRRNALARGRGLRHPRHADRAGRRSPPTGAARRRSGARREPRPTPPRTPRSNRTPRRRSGRPEGDAQRDAQGRRRRTRRRCASSSARRRSRSRPATTSRASRSGTSGSPSRSRPRAGEGFWARSDVEADVQHVAVDDDVVLALDALHAPLLRLGVRSARRRGRPSG